MQLFVAGSWVGLEMHQRKLWKRWNDIALKQQPLTALSPALASIRKNIHPLSPYLYGRCSIVESLLFSCQVLQHFSTIPPGFLWSASRTFTLHFIIRAFLTRSFSSFRKACPASSLPALIIYKVFFPANGRSTIGICDRVINCYYSVSENKLKLNCRDVIIYTKAQ